jgi:hypothetical protein
MAGTTKAGTRPCSSNFWIPGIKGVTISGLTGVSRTSRFHDAAHAQHQDQASHEAAAEECRSVADGERQPPKQDDNAPHLAERGEGP